MSVISRAISGAVIVLCASSAFAQTATTLVVPAAAPTGAVAAQPTAVLLTSTAPNIVRAGTPIALRMSEGLTTQTKKLRTGQRFQMEVAEPVVVNGVTVIAAGSPATGEITQVRNKGMWGKSGYIGAQALYVRANGRQIRLTGTFDDKGVTGTAAVIGAVAFVPVVGFFTTGTSAKIPMGSGIKAFIDEDIAFAVDTAPAPAPMVVAQPTVTTAVAAAPAPTPAAPVLTPVVATAVPAQKSN